MRKLELMKLLKDMPGNPEIHILDIARQYAAGSSEEPTKEGIYSQYDVIRVPRRYLPKGVAPFVVLAFNTNPDIQIDPDIFLREKDVNHEEPQRDFIQRTIDPQPAGPNQNADAAAN